MVYYGSKIFSFLTDYTGLPIDQINFLLTQLIALTSGFFFRQYLKPCPQNTLKRHLVAMLWGILLGHFCYGRQMWHLFFQAFVSYLCLQFVPRKYVHLVVTAFSMGYLSILHLHRLIYDYGNYTLDITSPLMISTQKLSALAFAFYDGYRNVDKLTPDQKSQAISDCPHIIEFLSYIFNFQGIAVGPLCFYKDYIDFVDGNNILKHKKKSNDEDVENSNIIVQPDNKIPILKKFLTLILLCIVFFKVTLVYPVLSNIDTEILEKPVWYRIIFLYITTSCTRARYYIAWVLADMVNNASGLGFNGYDENGNAKWDLVTNVQILKLELATSIKVVFDSWNIQTQVWLRRICFDRLPTLKTIGVFILSAFWHGFYAGYYFAFVTAGFAVYAGRGIRRKIRPTFQKNSITKVIYAIITWIGTELMLSYSAAAFELYQLTRVIKFYNSWYWWITIIIVTLTIVLPGGSTKKDKNGAAKSVVESEKNNNKNTKETITASVDVDNANLEKKTE